MASVRDLRRSGSCIFALTIQSKSPDLYCVKSGSKLLRSISTKKKNVSITSNAKGTPSLLMHSASILRRTDQANYTTCRRQQIIFELRVQEASGRLHAGRQRLGTDPDPSLELPEASMFLQRNIAVLTTCLELYIVIAQNSNGSLINFPSHVVSLW